MSQKGCAWIDAMAPSSQASLAIARGSGRDYHAHLCVGIEHSRHRTPWHLGGPGLRRVGYPGS